MTLNYCFTAQTDLWAQNFTSIPDATKPNIPSYVTQILEDWERLVAESFPQNTRNALVAFLSQTLTEKIEGSEDALLLIPLVHPRELVLGLLRQEFETTQARRQRDRQESKILHQLMGKEIH